MPSFGAKNLLNPQNIKTSFRLLFVYGLVYTFGVVVLSFATRVLTFMVSGIIYAPLSLLDNDGGLLLQTFLYQVSGAIQYIVPFLFFIIIARWIKGWLGIHWVWMLLFLTIASMGGVLFALVICAFDMFTGCKVDDIDVLYTGFGLFIGLALPVILAHVYVTYTDAHVLKNKKVVMGVCIVALVLLDFVASWNSLRKQVITIPFVQDTFGSVLYEDYSIDELGITVQIPRAYKPFVPGWLTSENALEPFSKRFYSRFVKKGEGSIDMTFGLVNVSTDSLVGNDFYEYCANDPANTSTMNRESCFDSEDQLGKENNITYCEMFNSERSKSTERIFIGKIDSMPEYCLKLEVRGDEINTYFIDNEVAGIMRHIDVQ